MRRSMLSTVFDEDEGMFCQLRRAALHLATVATRKTNCLRLYVSYQASATNMSQPFLSLRLDQIKS